MVLSPSAAAEGRMGCSGDQQTVSLSRFLDFSSRRITRHRGQTLVWLISEIRNNSGYSLFPVPMAEMMGMECSLA